MTHISQYRPAEIWSAKTGELKTRPVERVAPRPSPAKRETLPEVGPPEVTAENIAAYLKSKAATAFLGKVSLPVIQARLEACIRCPHRGQHSRDPDPVGYCRACGCGWRKEGALTVKAEMRQVKRPAGCLWPVGD